MAVKLTFKEKFLVPFGITKKGNFMRYETKYVLNTNDAEGVRSLCESKLSHATSSGRFVENSQEGIHWFWDSQERTITGQILVWKEVKLTFTPTKDGKIEVTHEEIDHKTCNARYNVEKSFVKLGLIKRFGLVE